MTVHCKRTLFLRGQIKLKFAGSVQGALCYWQYKGRSGMPKVSVICCLNINWSLGTHTWHFTLPFCIGWLLLTWASSFIFYTLFSVVQSTLSKYGDSILIGISVCPSKALGRVSHFCLVCCPPKPLLIFDKLTHLKKMEPCANYF